MRIIYILIFIGSTGLHSCSLIDENTQSELEVFDALRSVHEGSMIYVIPGSGCPGCISEVEKFALSKRNSDSFYFIFTRLRSIKTFKLRFSDLMTAKNVILDTTNIYHYKEDAMTIYPVLYEKRNHKLLFKRYLKPD